MQLRCRRLAIGVIFAVSGLVIQLMYKPFKHPSENALAAVSQGIIALALVVGGLLRASEAEVAAMVQTGDVDSFVAGVYMITSGAILYIIAAVIWFGNPLYLLCHPKTIDGKPGRMDELAAAGNQMISTAEENNDVRIPMKMVEETTFSDTTSDSGQEKKKKMKKKMKKNAESGVAPGSNDNTFC